MNTHPISRLSNVFAVPLVTWLALSSCVVATPARVVVRPDPPPVSASVTFYETLSPYGDWLVVADYGRVWRPHRHIVGVGFTPYLTGGSWAHSSEGWVFEVQWTWGWLPFHYGRWYFDDLEGWLWVPDTVWSTAWVEWRYGGGYVGWMPLPPHHHRRPNSRWSFVPSERFAQRDVEHARVDPDHERIAFEASAPVPPPTGRAYAEEPSWSNGPPIERLRREARVEIKETTVALPPAVSRERMFPANLAPVRPAEPPPALTRPVPEREPVLVPRPDREPPAAPARPEREPVLVPRDREPQVAPARPERTAPAPRPVPPREPIAPAPRPVPPREQLRAPERAPERAPAPVLRPDRTPTAPAPLPPQQQQPPPPRKKYPLPPGESAPAPVPPLRT